MPSSVRPSALITVCSTLSPLWRRTVPVLLGDPAGKNLPADHRGKMQLYLVYTTTAKAAEGRLRKSEEKDAKSGKAHYFSVNCPSLGVTTGRPLPPIHQGALCLINNFFKNRSDRSSFSVCHINIPTWKDLKASFRVCSAHLRHFSASDRDNCFSMLLFSCSVLSFSVVLFILLNRAIIVG